MWCFNHVLFWHSVLLVLIIYLTHHLWFLSITIKFLKHVIIQLCKFYHYANSIASMKNICVKQSNFCMRSARLSLTYKNKKIFKDTIKHNAWKWNKLSTQMHLHIINYALHCIIYFRGSFLLCVALVFFSFFLTMFLVLSLFLTIRSRLSTSFQLV